jgi:hypothetical protein
MRPHVVLWIVDDEVRLSLLTCNALACGAMCNVHAWYTHSHCSTSSWLLHCAEGNMAI